jgi:hypothetical protein
MPFTTQTRLTKRAGPTCAPGVLVDGAELEAGIAVAREVPYLRRTLLAGRLAA